MGSHGGVPMYSWFSCDVIKLKLKNKQNFQILSSSAKKTYTGLYVFSSVERFGFQIFQSV